MVRSRAVRYGQKIYITIFYSISILITILTQTDMLYLTSYLFLHILLVFAHLTCLAHLVLHFSLFYYTFYSLFLVFTYIYIYICSCVVLLLYNFYSLHCPLSGPDLIYISLLIIPIPCIIYHVTNKETLTFTVINAFCVNLKHISKGNQLDLSQKVVTCL